MSTTILTLADLTKTFKDFWYRPKVRAVDGLSLSITRGEVFGLLGPNGSGKSTTIKMILGLLRPTSGTVSVFGDCSVRIDASFDMCLYEPGSYTAPTRSGSDGYAVGAGTYYIKVQPSASDPSAVGRYKITVAPLAPVDLPELVEDMIDFCDNISEEETRPQSIIDQVFGLIALAIGTCNDEVELDGTERDAVIDDLYTQPDFPPALASAPPDENGFTVKSDLDSIFLSGSAGDLDFSITYYLDGSFKKTFSYVEDEVLYVAASRTYDIRSYHTWTKSQVARLKNLAAHLNDQRRRIHAGNVAEMLIMLMASPNFPVVTLLLGIIECLKSWMFRRATCVSTCEGKINKQSLLEAR